VEADHDKQGEGILGDQEDSFLEGGGSFSKKNGGICNKRNDHRNETQDSMVWTHKYLQHTATKANVRQRNDHLTHAQKGTLTHGTSNELFSAIRVLTNGVLTVSRSRCREKKISSNGERTQWKIREQAPGGKKDQGAGRRERSATKRNDHRKKKHETNGWTQSSTRNVRPRNDHLTYVRVDRPSCTEQATLLQRDHW
jgi:hypothetical protein